MNTQNASHFDFLTTDGMIAVHFSPSLPQPAYPELLDAVTGQTTSQECRERLEQLAQRWRVELIVD